MKALFALVPYLRPYRRRMALGLVFVIAASAVTAIIPWFLGRAIDGITHRQPVAHVIQLAALMILCAVLGGALRYGMRELMNGVSRYVEYDMRARLFSHLEQLDATYYGRTRTGDIMARLTNDLGAVRMAAGPAIMYLVTTIASGAFALVLMLRVDLRLTLLSLLPMAILPLIMIRLGRVIHDRFEAVQRHFSTLTTDAQENLSGARIVRAYRQEPAEVKRFAGLNDEYLRKNMRLVHLYGAMNPMFGLLAGVAAVIVLGFGGALVVKGTVSTGNFVAFGFYLGALTWPLIALGWVVNLFERGAASMGRLNEIFHAQPAVTDAARTRHLPPALGGRSIEFRRVGFHYPVSKENAQPRWVLRDVSFTIPAGGTLGVVGATGSGKSAMLDLIPRLYDPQEGEILLDGVPIRDVPLAELRHAMGVVPQESLLFSETIASNLAYGLTVPASATDVSPVATMGASSMTAAVVPSELMTPAAMAPENTPPAIDREEAADDEVTEWAAHVAQLDTTIADFAGGYHTLLGERGINLSGGQKQRAALARALARKPAMVLLDDALSAVDTHTEARILQGLREALAGRTSIIASHRVSAIREATWIVVLDDGRVVEQGRHDDLIAAGGRYWSLLRRQQLVDALEEEAA